jgi:signal transduction histidine kinase
MAMKNQEIKSTVDTFLDINKIELNRVEILHEPVDIVELTKRTTDQMKILGESKQIKVEFVQPTVNIPQVNGDQFKLPNVITNLISNAIKYNNNGGWVKVMLEATDLPPVCINNTQVENFVTVTVQDNGIGISVEGLETLFNKYERVSKEAKKIADGSGLGLFIAKKIVALHNGKIWAESDGEGKGTAFKFTLPVYVGVGTDKKV